MDELKAFLRCSLCSEGTGKAKWTHEFHIVFMENDHVNIGKILCHNRVLTSICLNIVEKLIESPSSPTCVRVVGQNSQYASMEAFLLHTSCVDLLRLFSGEILVTKLFWLCQILEPSRGKGFGFTEPPVALDYLNPVHSLIPCPRLYQNPPKKPMPKGMIPLPVEILMMILDLVSSETLVNIFCSSSDMMTLALLYCKCHPYHFYRFIGPLSSQEDVSNVVHAIFYGFSEQKYLALDFRWRLLRIMKLHAYNIANISSSYTPHHSTELQLSPLISLRLYQTFQVSIPKYVTTLEVFTIPVNSQHYVCGIGWMIDSQLVLHGRYSNKQSHLSYHSGNTLYFIENPLGIKAVKFGNTTWVDRTSELKSEWEGCSLADGSSELLITADCLKFRSIRWLKSAVSFEETLDYESEATLIQQFGNFATESVIFKPDLRGITMYYDCVLSGIVGICLHSTTETDCIGYDTGLAKFFPIHGPNEFITDIQIRFCSSLLKTLTIGVRTNWNRYCFFGSSPSPHLEYETRIFRAPNMHFICGVYFRVERHSYIRSLGVIISPGYHRPSFPENPTILPASILTPNCEHAFSLESSAPLHGIRRILWYNDGAYYTGLRFVYHSGISEVVGRIRNNHMHEVVLSEQDIIHQVRVVSHNQKINKIEFDCEEVACQNGTQYVVGNSTARFLPTRICLLEIILMRFLDDHLALLKF
ncbi:hypothetical protein LOZ36_001259 [Ophidiomyces ophidiicola]|nr:hypothetical protein LOZ36_001259 [Ophidiomyces ophidiicola]